MPLPVRPAIRHRLTPIALLGLGLATAVVVLAPGCSKARTSGATTAQRAPGPGPVAAPSTNASSGDQLSPQAMAGSASSASAGGRAGPSDLGGAVAPAQPQVVRNANIVVDVSRGSVPASYDAVANLATTNGGFIADSNLSTTHGAAPSGRLTLRVPVDHLATVLSALSKLGKVSQQDQQGTDVTGQLVDLGARIHSLQAEEDATRTLLGRAQAIGDILQIQGQLFNLRTQIEQLTGQQSQLNDKAAFATIAVQVVESGPARSPENPAKPKSTLVRAWSLAGHNIVAVLAGAAFALGWLAPLLIVALLALPALLWWRHRAGPGGPQPAVPEP